MIKITPTITLELDDNIADGQYTTLKADFFNNISLIELLKSIEAKYDSSTEDEYFIYCNLTTYLQVAARWLKTINHSIDHKVSYTFVKCALLQSHIGPRKNDYRTKRKQTVLEDIVWDVIWNEAEGETDDDDYIKYLRRQCDVSFHIASYISTGDTHKLKQSMIPHIKSALEKCLVEVKETISYNVLDEELQKEIFEYSYDIYNAEEYWLDPSPIIQTFFNPNLWKYPRMIIPSPIGGRVFFENFTDSDIENVVKAYEITGHIQNEDMDFKSYLIRLIRDGIEDDDVHKVIAKEREAIKFNKMDTELFIPINSNRLFIRYLLNNETSNDKELFEKCAI